VAEHRKHQGMMLVYRIVRASQDASMEFNIKTRALQKARPGLSQPTSFPLSD